MRNVIAYILLAGCSAPPPSAPVVTPVVLRPVLRPGQAAFESTCGACHQASGLGMPGTFPPLAGSSWAVGAPEVPVAIVLRGLQGPLKVGEMSYSGSMPAQPLKDAEIAEILTYVRSSWGNAASAVTVDQVAAVRKRVGQGGQWSEAELRKALGGRTF